VSAAKTPAVVSAGSGRRGERRLGVLIWLAWRFLPPLDRADLRVLVRLGAACAYLAAPLTIGLAAGRLPAITVFSLLCLCVPALPTLWRNAIRLGERRRGTALALRQVRMDRRTAAAVSLSRQLAYPAAGALLGVLLIALLHRPLRAILPEASPLAVAIKDASGGWAYATALAVLVLIGLTALLGTERSRNLAHGLRRALGRFDRRAAQPQPQ
jgi:hypothetical protein